MVTRRLVYAVNRLNKGGEKLLPVTYFGTRGRWGAPSVWDITQTHLVTVGEMSNLSKVARRIGTPRAKLPLGGRGPPVLDRLQHQGHEKE